MAVVKVINESRVAPPPQGVTLELTWDEFLIIRAALSHCQRGPIEKEVVDDPPPGWQRYDRRPHHQLSGDLDKVFNKLYSAIQAA